MSLIVGKLAERLDMIFMLFFNDLCFLEVPLNLRVEEESHKIWIFKCIVGRKQDLIDLRGRDETLLSPFNYQRFPLHIIIMQRLVIYANRNQMVVLKTSSRRGPLKKDLHFEITIRYCFIII
jgi:hypothetical protein